ncbi:MAG TPA: hypothetical protein DCS09_12495 [Porphyromonadaceae bacterium]|nr:MAG: hypothetical protein A2071_09785 [Bacteroidetes bacterium GWC1_47_7]HAR39318.1 hypothetical protein [Porphyromonadaceae bacterium]
MKLFPGKLFQKSPSLHWNGTLTFGDDVPSSQQREKGEIMPEAVGLAFDDTRQSLVSSVVPYFRMFAPAFGALLVLVEPGPEIGCHITTLCTGKVVFVLYLDT